MCKLKIVNQLAFCGLIVGMCGTFFSISDGISFFKQSYDHRITFLVHTQKGLENLSLADATLEEKFLGPGQKGFKEILEVIKENVPPGTTNQVRGITRKRAIKISLPTNQEITAASLVFLDHGNNKYTVLGFDNVLIDWIKNHRQDWFLWRGLWIIFAGFTMSALSQVCFNQSETRNQKPTGTTYIVPPELRDVHVARYNHLNSEITRYRDLVWKVVLSAWGIYGGLIWFFYKGDATQIFFPDIKTSLLLILVLAVTFCSMVFHLYFEFVSIIDNQKRRQTIEEALGLNKRWRHDEKPNRFGFWFTIITFECLIWGPFVILLFWAMRLIEH